MHTPKWFATKESIRNILLSLAGVLWVMCLFQTFRTGNAVFDLIVFRIGLRVLAVAVAAAWLFRGFQKDAAQTASALGIGLIAWAALTAIRILVALAFGDRQFGDYGMLSPAFLLLAIAWHLFFVLLGVSLLLYARHRRRAEEDDGNGDE